MRRESSTVVALVGSARSAGRSPGLPGPGRAQGGSRAPGRGGPGQGALAAGRNQPADETAGLIPDPLLVELDSSANISVVRPPTRETDAVAAASAALSQAARRSSPFALVPVDPLADVAAGWQAMWDLPNGSRSGTVLFEERAARALAAWRARQFELPDYYLVLADALGIAARPPARAADSGPEGAARPGRADVSPGAGPEFYLGPLRAARPNRVVVVPAVGAAADQAAEIRHALRSLPHGRWWPPLDEVLDIARRFYAGGLAEAGTTLATAPR